MSCALPCHLLDLRVLISHTTDDHLRLLHKVAKWARGDQCVNVAEDARGQSQEDQYIYVCIGELPRDPFPYYVPLNPNPFKFTD